MFSQRSETTRQVRRPRLVASLLLSAAFGFSSNEAWAQANPFGGLLQQVIHDAAQSQPQTQQGPAPQSDGGDGCQNTRTVVLGVLGAVGGALVGSQVAGKKNRTTGALVGAGLGGFLGTSLGAELDHRACLLKKIGKTHNLDIPIEPIAAPQQDTGAPSEVQAQGEGQSRKAVGLSVSVTETPTQFASGSDVLSPDAEQYFGEIADTYSAQVREHELPSDATDEDRQAVATLEHKVILLVGHTDDTGSSRLNAGLSERRARTVGALFARHGVAADRIYYQGAGETFPIADNRTEAGRAKNRRVEIVDLPDVATLQAYLSARAPHIEDYRPVESDWRQDPTEAAPAEPPPKPAEEPSTHVVHHTPPRRHIQGKAAAGSASAAPTKPVSGPVAAPATPALVEFDFGGQAVQTWPTPDIGKLPVKTGFSLVSKANAAALERIGLASCAADRPRIAYDVKSLKSGQPLPRNTGDYMPGLYGTSWVDTVNGQLVALNQVGVLRSGAVASNRPTLAVFRDYAARPDPKRSPDFSARPDVNVYKGDKALLYRVFAPKNSNLRCLDIVFPASGGFQSNPSELYYDRSGQIYGVAFLPHIAR
jgi:outer membrane protein OmpA-like peptidoglycan-associated protein